MEGATIADRTSTVPNRDSGNRNEACPSRYKDRS
jgi:hypothetical protein